MLTKDDLEQIKKALRPVREEVTVEAQATRDDLQAEIKLAGMRTASSHTDLENRVKNLTITVNNMDQKITTLDKNVSLLDKKIDKVH